MNRPELCAKIQKHKTINLNQIVKSKKVINGMASKLVEKMLALQKERQSVRREDDLDRVRNLEREIVRVDEEIDRRVYVLYGLTPDEIRIVEGKG